MWTMSIKFMAVTGSDDLHEAEQLGGKNLGVHYDIATNEITFQLQPCYYSDKKHSTDKARELVLLDQLDVAALRAGTRKLSRRNALSLVMGIYDPLGLISMAVIRGKILLRHLYSADVAASWDSDICQEEKRHWAS